MLLSSRYGFDNFVYMFRTLLTISGTHKKISYIIFIHNILNSPNTNYAFSAKDSFYSPGPISRDLDIHLYIKCFGSKNCCIKLYI